MKIIMNHDKAFTHGGIFHADDVFSAALLRMMNPDIFIERGNQVPDGYDGLVFDIGGGAFDHHQEDRRVREMVFRLRHSDCYGKSMGKTFWRVKRTGQTLMKNSFRN